MSKENPSLKRSKPPVSAMDYSLRLISVRYYSEKQLAEKLIKKNFSTEEISRVIKKLKEYGYLNDEKFAVRLIESQKEKLRGRIKAGYELHKKGVGRSLAEELIGTFYSEDEERKIALMALDKKKISLIKRSENELLFKKKLYDFLQWRGFSSGVIEEILNP